MNQVTTTANASSSLDRLRSDRGAAARSLPQPRRRVITTVLLPAAILAIAAGLLAWAGRDMLLPTHDVEVVPVIVTTVAAGSGEAAASEGTAVVQAAGWIEPDPHPVYVSTLISGTIEEILVLEGEPVEAGEVVARLVDDNARIDLDRAEATLGARTADRRMAVAEFDAVREANDALIERRRAVAAAEAGLAAVEAQVAELDALVLAERARLAALEDERSRKASLVESGAIAEGELETLRLRRDAQSAVLEATLARRPVLAARRAGAEAELEAARRSIDLLIDERRALAVAEAKLASADALLAQARSDLDAAVLRLERTNVRSPVDGVVMHRLVSPGSTLYLTSDMHGSHVLHLYDPEHLQVRVDVPLADAALVGVGQRATVEIEVLPDRRFEGTVTRVVRRADIQKNTVEVKVAIEDPDPVLTPEMLARVRFHGRGAATARTGGEGGSGRRRIFAPAELVRTDAEGRSSLLVTGAIRGDRGISERRAVELGRTRRDGWVEVTSGLRPGDRVIAAGSEGLGDGDRIRIVGESRRVARSSSSSRGGS